MSPTGTLRGGALIRAQPSNYSPEQVVQYLERVNYTEGSYTAEDIAAGRFPADIDNLSILVRRHYLSFALDHSPMHYSAGHTLDVTPEGLFKRLVVDRTGGTYCYGHNGMMLDVLRALGYRAYTSAARMNFGFYTGGENYVQWGHMVLLVQLGEAYTSDLAHTWLVDVAPGPPAPFLPLPLTDAPDGAAQGPTPLEFNRLTRGHSNKSSIVFPPLTAEHGSGELNGTKVNGANGHTPAAAHYTEAQAAQIWDAHGVWNLQYRFEGQFPNYATIYQFSEQEYFQADFDSFHWGNMFQPHKDVFWADVVGCRYVLADEDNAENAKLKITERPVEKITLFKGYVKRRRGKDVLETVKLMTEEDRVKALKKYFDVTIDEKDIAHISGRDAAIDKLEHVDMFL